MRPCNPSYPGLLRGCPLRVRPDEDACFPRRFGAFLIAWAVSQLTAVIQADPAPQADRTGRSSLAFEVDFELPANSYRLVGEAALTPGGPGEFDFKSMPAENQVLSLGVAGGKGGHAEFPDPGDLSPLDFDLGDTITMEAWVQCEELRDGQLAYVVGKGRTGRAEDPDNQNYALRLRGDAGSAKPSFLFRSRASEESVAAYHRWIAAAGFPVDARWHFVTVSYTFGEPESIQTSVDGRPVKGKWDMGGPTVLPPVVDNDSLWIGSAVNDRASNTLIGKIDDVRIHRRCVPLSELKQRYQPILRPPAFPAHVPSDVVDVRIWEVSAPTLSLPVVDPDWSEQFELPAMALSDFPAAFAEGGIRRDRRGVCLLQMSARIPGDRIPIDGGQSEWMVRASGLTEVWLDGTRILHTPPHKKHTGAHNGITAIIEEDPHLHPLHPGDEERRASWQAAAITNVDSKHVQGGKPVAVPKPVEVIVQTLVGGKDLRSEVGELIVAFRPAAGDPWSVASPVQPFTLEDGPWRDYERLQRRLVEQHESRQRRATARSEDDVWSQRHAFAQQWVQSQPVIRQPGTGSSGSEHVIDRFLDERRDPLGVASTPHASATAFIRRVALDVVGVPPRRQELNELLASLRQRPAESGRLPLAFRQCVVDHFLLDAQGRADHLVSEWQDALAENPNVLKPTLNNTGPFRFFLHDALHDNTPVDRWVTELIRMRGSASLGGPAGFGLASQNDVPLAAKAHVLSSVFLGANMECARCHDAPYHDWTQKDLFSIAAMLNNQALDVPASSSVPAAFFESETSSSLITVTLPVGKPVEPEWPLSSWTNAKDLPPRFADSLDSPREQLAFQITRPENQRFAQTIVNRTWRQLLGEGLIEPLHDWEAAKASHPDLLRVLAREFTASGYDLLRLQRTIMLSDVYARVGLDRPVTRDAAERLFASPRKRRLRAEQVVDSLHHVLGRSIASEELTFDPEARMRSKTHHNLGRPRRAWQFTSLSNERDRPSLSLPRAATVCDCLSTLGWKGVRQEPVHQRDDTPNVLQPAVLASGTLMTQITRLCDGDALTRLCIDARDVGSLVEALFETILSRPPSDSERRAFMTELGQGFSARITGHSSSRPTPIREPFVSWANHLSPEANSIRIRETERLRHGPAPTNRITSAWRERAEDAIWALLNTPEFLYTP
ncbi:MAG: DUF1553 domain-containing protein [Planctomycetota bacterium]